MCGERKLPSLKTYLAPRIGAGRAVKGSGEGIERREVEGGPHR